MTDFGLELYGSREEWLQARLSSTGGSEIVNILGARVDGREPRGLWWEWVRKNPAAWAAIGSAGRQRWKESNDAWRKNVNVRARLKLEEVIEEWARKELLEAGRVVDPGQFTIARRELDPNAHYSPDGLLMAGDARFRWLGDDGPPPRIGLATGVEADLSYKTARESARGLWSPRRPSEYALYQVQWGLYVMDLEGGHILTYVGYGDSEKDRLHYEIERDDELIGLMREANERFWRWVDEDTPPPVDGLAKTTEAIRLYYRASRKPEKVVLLPPACRWEHPVTGKAMSFAQMAAAERRAARRIDELERERELYRQALELELAARDKEGGQLVIARRGKPPVTYARRLTSVDAAACDCGSETRKAYEYTSFKRKKR